MINPPKPQEGPKPTKKDLQLIYQVPTTTLTLQRKSHLCIHRNGIVQTQSHVHIHVSVSDLYLSMIGPHIFLQQNRQTDHGNI